jgi:hypothetical protein
MSDTHDRDKLARYVEGALSNADRVDVEAHVRTCAPCREYLDFIWFLRAGLRENFGLNPIPTGQCPSAKAVLDLMDRKLSRAEVESLRTHIARCPECSSAYRALKQIRGPQSVLRFTFKMRPKHLLAYFNYEFLTAGTFPLPRFVLADHVVIPTSSEEAEDLINDVKSEAPLPSMRVVSLQLGGISLEVGCRLEADGRLILGVQPAAGASLANTQLSLISREMRNVYKTIINVPQGRGFGLVAPRRLRVNTLRLTIGTEHTDVSLDALEFGVRMQD